MPNLQRICRNGMPTKFTDTEFVDIFHTYQHHLFWFPRAVSQEMVTSRPANPIWLVINFLLQDSRQNELGIVHSWNRNITEYYHKVHQRCIKATTDFSPVYIGNC